MRHNQHIIRPRKIFPLLPNRILMELLPDLPDHPVQPIRDLLRRSVHRQCCPNLPQSPIIPPCNPRPASPLQLQSLQLLTRTLLALPVPKKVRRKEKKRKAKKRLTLPQDIHPSRYPIPPPPSPSSAP